MTERKVRSAVRRYGLRFVTNDTPPVRQFIAARGAGGFAISVGFGRLSLAGGAPLTWRRSPVLVICLERGNKEMLQLSLLDRARTKGTRGGK